MQRFINMLSRDADSGGKNLRAEIISQFRAGALCGRIMRKADTTVVGTDFGSKAFNRLEKVAKKSKI